MDYFKKIERSVTISADKRSTVDLQVDVWSQDLNVTKFILKLDTTDSATIDLTNATVRVAMVYSQDGQDVKIEAAGIVEDVATQKIAYVMDDKLAGFEGLVIAGFYVTLSTGQRIDIQNVTFNMRKSLLDKDLEAATDNYYQTFDDIVADVQSEGETAKTQINQVLPDVQAEGEKVKTDINAVVSGVNGYADSQKQAINNIVSDVQSTGDTAKADIKATLPTLQNQVSQLSENYSELKEDIANINNVIYVDELPEMIANSFISSTSDMTFVGNDFTLTNFFGGIFGFETGHHYKMILIPTASSVYASLKILNSGNGTYIATLLPTTYIAKDNAVVIDIPNTITWDNKKRIVFQNSDTYITKGKLYIYDVTELPENVIESIDFAKCTNPLRVEVLSVSDENAKKIVNFDNWYKEKKLTTLGDSITEQNLWQSFVKDKMLFSSIVNKGIGGTRISGNSENAMWQNKRINALPLDTDVLTIMGGTNDGAASVNIGELSITNHDTNTFVGAYNVLISKVLYKFYNLSSGKYSDVDYSGLTKSDTFKDIVIYIMTPPFNANTQYSGENSSRLKSIADATKEVAKMWGIPCIDVFNNAGINTENVSYFLGDGVHPNANGAKKIASVIINGMKYNMPII